MIFLFRFSRSVSILFLLTRAFGPFERFPEVTVSPQVAGLEVEVDPG